VIRTQIQFTADQITALRELSATTGKSIAELTRDAVDAFLAQGGERPRSVIVEQAIAIAGHFSSGIHDVSAGHDRYLSEAFGQ
jgi:hypothetical protein